VWPVAAKWSLFWMIWKNLTESLWETSSSAAMRKISCPLIVFFERIVEFSHQGLGKSVHEGS
jgi:hypothetical protein